MKIAFKDTFDLQLKHPITGELLEDENGPVIITLYGKHTHVYKNAMVEMVRESRGKDLSEGEADELVNKMMVKFVAGFKNISAIETENGRLDSGSPIDVIQVFWIKEQIDKAIQDLESFMLAP